MIFEIDRATSIWDKEKAPLMGVKKMTITYKGSGAKRSIWVINVNTLEELQEIIKNVECGIIIKAEEDYVEDVNWELLIYDTYIE